MLKIRNQKGQSLIEYSLIFAAIVVGIIFMQVYVRRGMQGRLKESSDQIGSQYSVVGTYNYLTNRYTDTNETTDAAGRYVTNTLDQTTRTGHQELNAEAEPWKLKGEP